jgi:hypothetical protein
MRIIANLALTNKDAALDWEIIHMNIDIMMMKREITHLIKEIKKQLRQIKMGEKNEISSS